MRISTFLIVVCAVAGIGIGAVFVGHAVDGPARQLDTVLSEPAEAAGATAEANLQSAIAAAASYRIEHGTYAGMTTTDLRSYDAGLPSSVSVRAASAGAYCVESTVAGVTASIRIPNGSFVAEKC